MTALLCNEWTLAALSGLYGELLSPSEKMTMRFFDLVLIAAGLAVIVYRNTRYSANIFLSICSLSFFIIAAESYFRIFDPRLQQKNGHDAFFEYNSTLGWDFIPNRSGMFKLQHEEGTKVSINSAGMRDREYALSKPKGKKRIAVLGDSFTSGLEVNDREVFTEIMEDRLLADTEVLNFGVNGFGPAQEFLLLMERGFKYDPDLVIMVVYIGNDFDDVVGLFDWNGGNQRPKAFLEDGGKVSFKNIPVPRSKLKRCLSFLDEKLWFLKPHILELIRQRLYDKNDLRFMPPEVRLCRKGSSARTKLSYDTMNAVIKVAGDLCREKGIKFLVVVAPTVVQVYADRYWDKVKKTYHLKDDEYDLFLPNKELKRACASQGVPVFDLTPALRSCAESGRDVYYHGNQHWTKAGHGAAAEAIAGYLKDSKLF